MNLHKTIGISLLISALSMPVFAMSLNEAMGALSQAKANGLVGEMANGYLGIVKTQGNAAEITKLINDARKQEYQTLAKKNGITLGDVEKMAGQKAQEKTPTGQYINNNGKWQKK